MPILKKQKLLEQEEEKYHCRLCDKRFNSGRALGGHMRVHGMFNIEGEFSDDSCLPTSHICQNCRKEFCSLKSLSKHYCHSFVGTGGNHGENENSNGFFPPSLPRSRTPTPPLVLTEEEHVANCFVLLSTARANPIVCNTDATECSTSVLRITDVGECSTSERKKVDYVILPLSSPQPEGPEPHISTETAPIPPIADTSSQFPLPKEKPKVHECSICKRQFPSGQALGGHKRCHWRVSNSRDATVEPLSVVATELQFENVLNVNIKEAESREVRLNDLSHLIDINEREVGSTWLQIGFESISKQETRADQP